MASLLALAKQTLKEIRRDNPPAAPIRCPRCQSMAHTAPGPACQTRPVVSCRDTPTPAPVAPCPPPVGVEYEPGQDWPDARPVDLVYREGERPAWCKVCDVELVNPRVPDGLCGPCRWAAAQARRRH